MAYATVAELVEHLSIQSHVSLNTTRLEAALNAASAGIDEYTGRTFVVPVLNEEDEYDETARIFPAAGGRVLVDDAFSVSAVESSTDRQTWTAVTTWWTLPDNHGARSEPATTIGLETGVAGWLRVTGVWGWPVVPAQVKPACLLKAARLVTRAASPTGVEGFADFGVFRVSRFEDGDVVLLLDPLRRGDRVFGIA